MTKAPLCKGSSAEGGEGLSLQKTIFFTTPPSRHSRDTSPYTEGGLQKNNSSAGDIYFYAHIYKQGDNDTK